MRLLIDEGVDVRVMTFLKKEFGHDARRGPLGAKNGTVIRLAREERRVLITRDSDFANTLLYPPPQYTGIIYLAIHPPWPEKIIPPLRHLLNSVNAFSGKTFVLEETGYRQFP